MAEFSEGAGYQETGSWRRYFHINATEMIGEGDQSGNHMAGFSEETWYREKGSF